MNSSGDEATPSVAKAFGRNDLLPEEIIGDNEVAEHFKDELIALRIENTQLQAQLVDAMDEILQIKEGMAYRNSLVGRLEAECDQLRQQLTKLKE